MADMQTMATAYRNIRDARAKASREWKAQDKDLKTKLDRIGNAMLAWLETNKTKSVAVEGATVYKELDVLPTIADDQALFDWIIENRALDAFQRRLKVQFFVDYMKANDDAIPPGVNIYKTWKAVVRKAGGLTDADPEDGNE